MYNLIAEQEGEISIFYIMYNTDMEIFVLQFENDIFIPSEYAEFKRSNGWTYIIHYG